MWIISWWWWEYTQRNVFKRIPVVLLEGLFVMINGCPNDTGCLVWNNLLVLFLTQREKEDRNKKQAIRKFRNNFILQFFFQSKVMNFERILNFHQNSFHSWRTEFNRFWIAWFLIIFLHCEKINYSWVFLQSHCDIKLFHFIMYIF